MENGHSSLASLPASVLDQILSLADLSPTAIRLWACGSKNLSYKIEQALSHVDLEGIKVSPRPLPRMLSNLRNLRSLLVQTHKCLPDDLPILFAAIFSLSKTLTELRIFGRFNRQRVRFFGAEESSKFGNLYPHLQTLAVKVDSEQSIVGMSRMERFPSSLTCLDLHELTLVHCSPDGDPLTHYDIIATLPRSLTRIEGYVEIDGQSEDAPTLASLTRAWAGAPPNLEYIRSLFYIGSKVSWAPRSLTAKLEIHPNTMSEAMMLQIPPQLRSLSFHGSPACEQHWSKALPRNLTALDLDCPAILDSFASWPSTITRLSCEGPDLTRAVLKHLESGKPIASLWPPSLRSLTASNFSLDDIYHMPKTLEHLDVVLSDSQTHHLNARSLPPRLRKLVIFFTSTKISSIKKNLPATLTSLEILGPGRIQPSFLQACPPLVALSLYWVNAASVDWFNLLPRSLARLAVTYLSGIRCVEERLGTVFDDLPTSLTELRVRDVATDFEGGKLRPQRLDHLSLLKTLELRCAHECESAMLRKLPSSLTWLKLPISDIADEDLPFIPPRLSYCVFNCNLYDSKYIPFLPRNFLSQVPVTPGDSSRAQLIKERAAEVVKPW